MMRSSAPNAAIFLMITNNISLGRVSIIKEKKFKTKERGLVEDVKSRWMEATALNKAL